MIITYFFGSFLSTFSFRYSHFVYFKPSVIALQVMDFVSCLVWVLVLVFWAFCWPLVKWIIFSIGLLKNRIFGGFFFFFLVVNFVIHWNEKALGSHVFPIPIPPWCLFLNAVFISSFPVLKRVFCLWTQFSDLSFFLWGQEWWLLSILNASFKPVKSLSSIFDDWLLTALKIIAYPLLAFTHIYTKWL